MLKLQCASCLEPTVAGVHHDCSEVIAALRARAEAAEAALRSVAGAVGEFAAADGKNIVEKIEFLRKDYEERIGAVVTALCRAREDFQHIAEYWNGNDNYNAMNDALHHISEVADAALSSSAPCPHEAEAKRLREGKEGG